MGYKNKRIQSKSIVAVGLFVLVALTACDDELSNSNEVLSADPHNSSTQIDIEKPSADETSARTARLWSTSCALCHVSGNAGAPQVGMASQWLPRLAKGEAILLQHTIEGFNDMPPLGYCMACERADFVAMIEFMTQGMNLSAGESGHE